MLNKICRYHKGFTLIEIAIVVFIVGLLLTAIMKGESLIQESRVQDTLSIAADLSTATRAFKQRYHYLPGDLFITGASPEIPGVSAACMSATTPNPLLPPVGGADAGNGNGIIEAVESVCVSEHLVAAGFIKGGTGPIKTQYGTVIVIANAFSQTALGPNPLSSNIQNVIEFTNLPCEVAQQIDRTVDDGNIATGNARASIAACTGQDIVPYFAMPL